MALIIPSLAACMRMLLGRANQTGLLVFDLDPEIGVQRALKRHTSEDRFEHMDMTFHHRLRKGFLDITRQNPDRCHLIKADQSVEAIHQEIVINIIASHPHR